MSTKHSIISFLTYTFNIGLKNSNKKLKTYLTSVRFSDLSLKHDSDKNKTVYYRLDVNQLKNISIKISSPVTQIIL